MNKHAQKIQYTIGKEAPTLLAITAVFGFAGATYLAVKSTPKAIKLLEENDYILEMEKKDAYLERSKLLFPLYAPAAGVFMISTASVLLGNRISGRRIAALGGLYLASERSLSRLRDAVIERVGESGYSEIKTEADKPRDSSIMSTFIVSEGQTRVYDSYSDRTFTVSSPSVMRTKVNQLHNQLIQDGSISLNDVYYELGLGPIEYGESVGWTDQGPTIALNIGSAVDDRDMPYLTISFVADPEPLY